MLPKPFCCKGCQDYFNGIRKQKRNYKMCIRDRYKIALEQENAPMLWELLREGRICKEEVDGGR